MMRKLLLAAAAAACLSAGSASGAADFPNLERGQLLYENHCQVCHTSKIHRRPNRIPLTVADLRQIVQMWQEEEKLGWSEQDVEDVVYYLRQKIYRF